jgi:hypothetical protein
MTQINLTEFTLVEPKLDRNNALTVTVTPDSRVHLNGKLLEKIGSPFIFLRMHINGNQMLIEALKEHQAGAIRLPKSGDIKGTEVSRELSSLGLNLPAYFSVAWNDDISMWHGIHYPEKTPLFDKHKQKKISQPRKNGLKDMMR